MQVPIWKNLTFLGNSLSPSPHSALFHSTPISLAKWKRKWNSDMGRGEPPSKNYIRYASRQKLSDAKKALKNLLFKSTSSKLSFQDEDMTWNSDRMSNTYAKQEQDSLDFDNQTQSKKVGVKAKSHARPSQHHKSKCKQRKQRCYDEYDGPPKTTFQATFGSRCFTWTFRSWGDSEFQKSTWEFQWRNDSNWKSNRRKLWGNSNADDERTVIGSSSDRIILGLPSTGPLEMEDVKSAFRASALKWHPDKHQGTSQAVAVEKFKRCVDAYKSLCSALSTV